jgi:hypothetical protein
VRFFAGDLFHLPVLRDRSRPRPPTLDETLSALWRLYADGKITERVAERADEMLRAERQKIVVPLRQPGACVWPP